MLVSTRGARTHACSVHTHVNAVVPPTTGVRKSANTARMSACATYFKTDINRVVTYAAGNFTARRKQARRSDAHHRIAERSRLQHREPHCRSQAGPRALAHEHR